MRQRTTSFAVALVLDVLVTVLLPVRDEAAQGWRLVLTAVVLAGAGLASLQAIAPNRPLAVWGILVQALCAVAFAVALPFAVHATWQADSYLAWDAIVVVAIAGGYLNARYGPLWRYAASMAATPSGSG